jgi:hypothetical protein
MKILSVLLTVLAATSAADRHPLFDAQAVSGWRIDGPVRVEDGILVLGGDRETTATLEFGYGELCFEHRWKGGQSPRWSCTASQGEKHIGTSSGEFSEASVRGRGIWAVETWRVRADTNPELRVASDVGVNFRQDDKGSTLVQERTTRFPPGCRVVVQLTVPTGSRLFLRNIRFRAGGQEVGP